MPDPDLFFSAGSGLAMLCWLALAASLFAPPIRLWVWRIAGIAVPALFAMAYIGLIASGWGAATGGGFGSIGEVRALFAVDSVLTAGWLHYLAFDLFVGTWIAREGLAAGVPAILLVPCLLLTFLFGPAGLLLFLALRPVAARGAPA